MRILTLVPKVCKYYLLSAVWIPRVRVWGFRVRGLGFWGFRCWVSRWIWGCSVLNGVHKRICFHEVSKFSSWVARPAKAANEPEAPAAQPTTVYQRSRDSQEALKTKPKPRCHFRPGTCYHHGMSQRYQSHSARP